MNTTSSNASKTLQCRSFANSDGGRHGIKESRDRKQEVAIFQQTTAHFPERLNVLKISFLSPNPPHLNGQIWGFVAPNCVFLDKKIFDTKFCNRLKIYACLPPSSRRFCWWTWL